jgi:membrane protein YqaA with SNARE-associated domain
MRSLLSASFGTFLSPGGLILLGALDASVVFFLPLGIDFAVVLTAARRPELFWLHALMATCGSVAGAAVTFAIGRAIGKAGLTKLIHPSRLERVQQRVGASAALTLGALAIIPPPFPYTAFVLTSGALKVNPWSFFGMLGGVRLVRFSVEAALAAHFGRGILAWMRSPVFTAVVYALIVLAIAGTLWSAIALIRQRGTDRTPAGAH